MRRRLPFRREAGSGVAEGARQVRLGHAEREQGDQRQVDGRDEDRGACGETR